MKFTEWLKWDYRRFREAVYVIFGEKVPNWAFVIYYIIGALIFLPFMIPCWLFASYQVKKTREIFKSFEEFEA